MRVRSILLLMWLAMDLGNPALPGVFSFDGPQLFIDSAVSVGAAASPAKPQPHQPTAEPVDQLLAPQIQRSLPRAAPRALGRAARQPEPPARLHSSGLDSPSPDAH
jgi:hypothetical protein